MYTNLKLILLYIGLAQGTLAIIYVLVFKKMNTTTALFALFFFTFFSPVIRQIIFYSPLLVKYPWTYFLPTSFYYFTTPLFYLYVKSLFGKLKTKEACLFLVPGIVELCFYTTMMLLPSKDALYFREHYSNIFFPLVYCIILPIFSITLIFLTIARVNRYHQKYLDYFSNEQKFNVKWIKYTLFILALNYAFMFVIWFFSYLGVREQLDFAYLIDIGLSVIYMYWVSLYGIKQSHIPSEFQVFQNNKSNPVTHIEDFQKIEAALRSTKVYTNPNLTLLELSELVHMPTRKVSQAINNHGQVTFNHLINKFRVEEAKELLTDPAFANYTIEAVAKEAGFNSKSVFNTAFRSEAGQTPKSFKLAQTSGIRSDL